ncbi:DnaJ domain-containing protein [Lyngbya aestuarii]|uniref:DnaJ domain-containing protein n=1 Tax=Lyngbya aestuarii TaxID=118322 RepID=UPI00403D6DA1
MAENSQESVVFIASGATAGAGVSATIGSMGLAGSFGAVGIGMAPVTAAGAVAGAAAFGAFKAIEEGDAVALGAIGIGATAGAGVSATIGGMGLAGSFGAVGIGMGTMAAAGGVVGLGIYGFYKAFKQEPGQRMAGAVDALGRMESKVLEMEAYTQALLELDPVYAEWTWKQKFAALEVEEELEALKENLDNQTIKATEAKNQTTSEFTNSEIATEITPTDAKTSQSWKCLKVLPGHQASVNAIAVSPDGQTLASGSQDKTVSLWSLKTGKQIFTFFGQAGEVCTVAISPDGKTLVAGGFDNMITSWKLETKALVCSFFQRNSPYSHLGFVSSIAFSQDRKIVVSASGDRTIKLWGGFTGEFKRKLTGHLDTVWSVAITPDGQTIASGSADKTIRLWSIDSYQQPRILTGHSGWVTAVVITPDGNTLASASTDGTIKLWNLGTGELIRTIEGQSTPIFSLAISSDGSILASGSRKSVKLWQINTGELIQTLCGCSPVTFNPDGKILISGTESGKIKIWHQILGDDESIPDTLYSGEWWEVLGVEIDAEPHTVKLAYRQLAWQYHPDINPSANAIAKMQEINKAYEKFLKILSNLGVTKRVLSKL